MDAKPITARDVQRILVRDLHARSFVVPNYTPSGWWECDLFEVTAAGYFREWEIKLSLSDFRADAKKAEERWHYDRPTTPGERWNRVLEGRLVKHDLLAKFHAQGPAEFRFVLPKGLVHDRDVPSWAGIYLFERNEWGTINLWEHRTAPRLHMTKVDKAVRSHAEGTCYWRMVRMFMRGGDGGGA